MLISLFAVNVYATSSKFDSGVTVNNTLDDDTIQMILSFKGEDVSELKFKISYENKYLEYDGISYINDFYRDTEELANDVKWNTIILDVKRDSVLNSSNFAVLSFKLKKPLKDYTSIFVYNYEAKGDEKYTFLDSGSLVKVKTNDSEVLSTVESITKKTKTTYWFYEHSHSIIIIVGFIIAIAIVILMMPGRKKENRSKKIKNQVSDEK